MDPMQSKDYWIALCFGGRVVAGPSGTAIGPPWLFLTQEHAAQYVEELRKQGIPAEVRGWTAQVTEWQGQSLVRFPEIPEPAFLAAHVEQSTSSATTTPHDASSNGASGASVPPPPTPSLE